MINLKAKKTRLLLITWILTSLTSCGNKAHRPPITSPEKHSVTTFFTEGDPMNLLKGSTPNPISFITPENYKNFNDYALVEMTQFTEKEQIIEQAGAINIESGNEATNTDRMKNAGSTVLAFEQYGDEYIYSSPSFNLRLTFKLKNNTLDLISVDSTSGLYEVTTIHYSMKTTEDAFSILAKVNDKYLGKILFSFSFAKKISPKEIPTTDAKYKYLFGPGIIVPWNQKETLEVGICGKQSTELTRIYQTGINAWKEALSQRLNIVTKVLTTYPPFSDLNNHCIYTVNNYQTLPGNTVMNPGTTYTSNNPFQGNLLDSDIFIWVKENAKTGHTLEEVESLQKTITHEFGHLLGLDHQFTKDISSVMSYANIATVEPYDREAISFLYPLLSIPTSITFE